MANKKGASTTRQTRTRKIKKEEPVALKTEQTSSEVRGSGYRKVVNRKNAPIFLAVLAIVILGFLLYKFLVVAWVDTSPITRIQMYNQLEKRYGSEVTEQLITEQLIKNEAKKRNVNVSDEDINNEIKKIEEQQGGAAQLDQILSLQKITRAELKDQVELQLLVEKMFGNDINITEADINSYVEQNKAQLPTYTEGSSESAKLKDDVSNMLRRQQVNQKFREWLDNELKGSRIKRAIPTTPPSNT